MFNNLKSLPCLVLLACLLTACGESEAPQSSATVPASPAAGTEAAKTPITGTEQSSTVQKQQVAPVELENGVIYQEEIYRNWPYTEAPSVTAEPPVTEMIEKKVEEVKAMAKEQAVATTQAMETHVATAKEAVKEQVEKVTPAAGAKTHTINAEARVFNPDILYIQPGDTVGWINMTSHNTVSVEGLIPEGAAHWRGQLGENLKITLDVEGIYAYVCEPHIGFGMVGVIVVGKPGNLEEVKAYADKNLKGAYRRIIGKLIKVTIP